MVMENLQLPFETGSLEKPTSQEEDIDLEVPLLQNRWGRFSLGSDEKKKHQVFIECLLREQGRCLEPMTKKLQS